jgi:hypothetical protein
MRTNHAWPQRTLVAILLSATLLLAACTGDEGSNGGEDDQSQGVSATAYMDGVCTALSDWLADFLAGNEEVAGLDPDASVQEGKEKLENFLTDAVNNTEQAIDRLEVAGTPEVEGGSEFATRLITALEQARDALENASSRLDGLSNDPTEFQKELRDLGDTVRAQLNSAGTALGEMIEPLREVAQNTPSCQSLGGAFGGGPPAPPT